MSPQPFTPPARTDDEYAWLHDGNLPHSREDRIAEALALIALIFSLAVGLVIALLPVSAKAALPPAVAARAPQAGSNAQGADAAAGGGAFARARATIACASDA
jgi:hypothetical protein